MASASILPKLIVALNLNNYRFEQEIKAGNGSIQKLIDSDGVISDNLINKITIRFPEVPRKWLETEKGPMLIKPSTQKKLLLERLDAIEETIIVLRDQVREIKKMV